MDYCDAVVIIRSHVVDAVDAGKLLEETFVVKISTWFHDLSDIYGVGHEKSKSMNIEWQCWCKGGLMFKSDSPEGLVNEVCCGLYSAPRVRHGWRKVATSVED